MKKDRTRKKSAIRWWVAGYVVVLVLLTLRPFSGNIVMEKEFNLVLFQSLKNYWRHLNNFGIINPDAWAYFPGNPTAFLSRIFTVSFVNLAGNLILFMPLGYFFAGFFRKGKWIKTFGASLAVSAGIEGAQFVGLSSRIADVDDVVLNVAGAMAGCLFYWITWKWKERKWTGGKK